MTLHELLKNIINILKTTIKTTPQSLTDEEKLQARQNIDAVSINEVAQADWEQNDSSAPDYIKNKTHWTESGFEVIAEQTVSFDSDRMGRMTTTSGLVAGDTYKVTQNRLNEYVFTAREFMLEGMKACGIGDINDEGFVIYSVSGLNSVLLIQVKNYGTGLDIGQWPMKIEHFVEETHKLDPKFLPDGIGYVSEGEVIFSGTSLENDYSEDRLLGLEVGKTYTVTFNGVDYEIVAELSTGDTGEFVSLLYESDEMLFEVCDDINEGAFVIWFEGDGTATIEIKSAETIHKIDPKYLPEGGFGYTEVEKELASFKLDNGIYEGETPIGLVEGETYIIKTDAVTYEGVCINVSGFNYIGNPQLIGLPDNGDLYCVADALDENGVAIGCFAICEGSHMTISTAETVNTINGKYLPKGGAGYTEKKIFTHDGNYNDKVTFTESVYRYVRVGDSINFNDIVKAVVYYQGEQRVVLREYMETTEDENGNIAVKAVGLNGFYILTGTNPYNAPSGTYVVSNNDEFSLYIMQLETEVVYTIEDKYIPDAIARKSDIPSIDGLATEIYVDNKISAIPTPDVSGQIANHNSSTSAHSDIRNAINGKANSYHTHTASDLQGLGYLSTHPELNSTIIPFIYNDLAFLTLKGGSVKMYKTTSTDYTAVQLDEQSVGYDNLSKMFDGAPSYTCLSGLNDQTFVVIDMDLGRGYPWSNKFYIDFGNTNWAPKNLKLYVRNPSLDETYVLKGEYSNSRKNNWSCELSHLAGSGFSKIRLVLNGFVAENGTVGRIAQIGLISYGSSGVNETFISRGGCEGIYGNLLPNKNSDINLGSSEKHWNAIYVDEIVGAIPTVTASDSGKFLRVSANGLWVAETVPQIEEVAF